MMDKQQRQSGESAQPRYTPAYYSDVAKSWSEYLGHDIDAIDVERMLVLRDFTTVRHREMARNPELQRQERVATFNNPQHSDPWGAQGVPDAEKPTPFRITSTPRRNGKRSKW